MLRQRRVERRAAASIDGSLELKSKPRYGSEVVITFPRKQMPAPRARALR